MAIGSRTIHGNDGDNVIWNVGDGTTWKAGGAADWSLIYVGDLTAIENYGRLFTGQTSATATAAVELMFVDTGAIAVNSDRGFGQSADSLTSTGEQIVVITGAASSNTHRAHVYDGTSWTHQNISMSGGSGNISAIGVGGTWRTGSGAGGSQGSQSDTAVLAIMDGLNMSDAQCEALGEVADIQAHAELLHLWVFDSGAVDDVDDEADSATYSSQTTTAVGSSIALFDDTRAAAGGSFLMLPSRQTRIAHLLRR